MCKKKFITLTYANMNIKITQQSFDARSCLKLLLKKLKESRGPTRIYTPLGTYLKETSKEIFICASNKEVF